MKSTNLSELSDEALLQEEVKSQSSFKLFSILIGIMVGAAIFSTVVKGFSFSTLFPLFFAPLLATYWTKKEAVKKEIKMRQAKQEN